MCSCSLIVIILSSIDRWLKTVEARYHWLLSFCSWRWRRLLFVGKGSGSYGIRVLHIWTARCVCLIYYIIIMFCDVLWREYIIFYREKLINSYNHEYILLFVVSTRCQLKRRRQKRSMTLLAVSGRVVAGSVSPLPSPPIPSHYARGRAKRSMASFCFDLIRGGDCDASGCTVFSGICCELERKRRRR